MNDTINSYREELIQLVNNASQENGLFETRVPGVCTLRSDSKTCTNPGIYEPMLCLLLQGSKKLYIGEQELRYNELNYLLVPVMIPVVGEIIQASETEPYMG